MDNIFIYILVGLVGFFIVQVFAKLLVFYHKKGYDVRQQKKEAKKKERLKWKYCEVDLDNPLLNQMMQDRTLIFMGHKGTGKSLMMNLFAHFLWKKRLEHDKKNKRYLKYMNPEYLVQEKILEDSKLLPVYSNINFIDFETQACNQVLEPYFELRKKAVEKAIFCIDEISSYYGKDIYFSDEVDEARKKAIKENSKKNRHYTNGFILGTEQDGDNIFKGIRENGYGLVQCLRTNVYLAKSGKILRNIKNFFNFTLPAIFTVNLSKVMSEQLFVSGKIITFFKLLFPSYFSCPHEFYDRRQKINNKIKRKYQKFEVRFIYGTGEWYIRFTHEDMFDYNTREYKKEYDALFDENGNRIIHQEVEYED